MLMGAIERLVAATVRVAYASQRVVYLPVLGQEFPGGMGRIAIRIWG
jgi:hypothetical protein